MNFSTQDQIDWENICDKINVDFGQKPDINALLFLIGAQELGTGLKDFTRDEKMDLINLGTLKVLSYFGLYKEKTGGLRNWPVFERNEEINLPEGQDQEAYVKKGIIRYFFENNLLIKN